MRKTRQITLFGKKLILSERNAAEILAIYELARKNGDISGEVKFRAIAISDALSQNKKPLRFFSNRKLTASYLLSHLTVTEIMELFDQLNELEGIEDSKKKEESLSAEKS